MMPPMISLLISSERGRREDADIDKCFSSEPRKRKAKQSPPHAPMILLLKKE